MFLIRRAKPEDVSTLLKLARMVHFINLPPDKEIIDGKVGWARQCFMSASELGSAKRKSLPARTNPAAKMLTANENGALTGGLRNLTGRSPLFMFVMEELATGGVVGTSQLIAAMGGPGHPNISLQLAHKDFYSQSLQTGVRHTTARLHLDESGPTEVGGLILQPSFRGHKSKLGRFISFVRFHYIGLYRHLFADRVLAEMMGPISIDGYNPFWENCTRLFINMTYDEADKFCQESKEFILTLFPREEIYLTLLPPKARSTVGTVGPETVPAKRLLEKLGFKYHHRVDPFDGGPHLEAQTSDISLVKATQRAPLGMPVAEASGLKRFGIVSVVDAEGEFRAMEVPFDLDKQGRVVLTGDTLETLQGEPDMTAGFTPTDNPHAPAPDARIAEPASVPAPSKSKAPAKARK